MTDRRESGHPPPPDFVDPRRSALVVVDMQNDFVRVDAPLEVPQSRYTLPIIARLIDAARTHGVPVVYTRFIGTERPSLVWNFNPQIAAPIDFCRPGRRRRYGDARSELEGIAVVDELAPRPGELVVDKTGYDAFVDTALAEYLRRRALDTVLLTGTVTQICVESTARGAFERQIRPVVIRDAVSSHDASCADASLLTVSRSFGGVIDSSAALAMLTVAPLPSSVQV